jgi:hypothetical protein
MVERGLMAEVDVPEVGDLMTHASAETAPITGRAMEPTWGVDSEYSAASASPPPLAEADLPHLPDQMIYRLASSHRNDHDRLQIRIGARVWVSLHLSRHVLQWSRYWSGIR